MSEQRVTRREIIKKAAYLAPIVLTVQANFSFASAGSGDYTDNDKKDKKAVSQLLWKKRKAYSLGIPKTNWLME